MRHGVITVAVSALLVSSLSLGPVAWARGRVPLPPAPGKFADVAQAGKDEPAPPGGAAEPAKPGEPGAAKAGEPGAARPGEPGTTKAGEPGAAKAGEPGAATLLAKPKKPGAVQYGAGLQFRGIFVPEWFLKAFLDAATPMNSVSIGGEFIRRKGNFDLVASMNFGFYSPRDGNYLGKGKAPGIDTDYIQFRNLNVLAFDVAFIWHHDFTKWLSLVYGAGLGFGVVLGSIYRISNYDGNCKPENLKDFKECNPINYKNSADPKTYKPLDLDAWNRSRDAWLAGHTGSGEDTPGAPHQYREEGVWPVVPIVHLLAGVNFKISDHFSVRVDGGFHNAFYMGATGHYFF